ncbi:class I SAM-dependent methyltransferase [archaeon]|nr:MAG: class I SAM-dependent methyltransferase [archaeon]
MPDIRPSDTEKSYEKAAIRKIQVQMAQRILQELALSDSSFVLDAGCGSGFSMESANAISKNVFGFDTSSELLLVAKRKGIKNLARADFESIPFKENVFGAIISISALQWFYPKDKHDVKDHYAVIAKEFFRLLKSGGKAGLQFYPATEMEWDIAVKCFRKLFGGYIIEEGDGRKKKRYLILEKK